MIDDDVCVGAISIQATLDADDLFSCARKVFPQRIPDVFLRLRGMGFRNSSRQNRFTRMVMCQLKAYWAIKVFCRQRRKSREENSERNFSVRW